LCSIDPSGRALCRFFRLRKSLATAPELNTISYLHFRTLAVKRCCTAYCLWITLRIPLKHGLKPHARTILGQRGDLLNLQPKTPPLRFGRTTHRDPLATNLWHPLRRVLHPPPPLQGEKGHPFPPIAGVIVAQARKLSCRAKVSKRQVGGAFVGRPSIAVAKRVGCTPQRVVG